MGSYILLGPSHGRQASRRYCVSSAASSMRRHSHTRHGEMAVLSLCEQLRWIRPLSLGWPRTQVCCSALYFTL